MYMQVFSERYHEYYVWRREKSTEYVHYYQCRIQKQDTMLQYSNWSASYQSVTTSVDCVTVPSRDEGLILHLDPLMRTLLPHTALDVTYELRNTTPGNRRLKGLGQIGVVKTEILCTQINEAERTLAHFNVQNHQNLQFLAHIARKCAHTATMTVTSYPDVSDDKCEKITTATVLLSSRHPSVKTKVSKPDIDVHVQ